MTRHNKGNCTPNERMILTKVCVMMIVIFISFQRAGGSLEPKTRRKRWEETVLSTPSSPPSLCWTSPRNSGCPSSLIPLGSGPETWNITLMFRRDSAGLICTCLLVEDSTPSHLFSNLPNIVWGRSALADWESTGEGLSRRPRPSPTGSSKNWTVASAPGWKEI